MKRKYFNILYLLVGFLFVVMNETRGQDSVVNESILNVKYFSVNNTIPYLLVQSQNKLGKKYTPAKNVRVQVFINNDTNLVGSVITNKEGEGKIIFPTSIKEVWNASALQNFIAIATATKNFNETKTELPVTKCKITIDTVTEDAAKSITVTVVELKDREWIPAKDVELKIGVQRSASILPVADEETYTTDSIGQVVTEFKKDSLPGDEKGNVTLVAKVEDNETYGNLIVEKKVPWGTYRPSENNFNRRSLWATGDRAPTWLLFMAGSIIVVIWGVLIYLIFQLFKIKKLGRFTQL